jgi:Mrp family chromosome partitioning ATPase
MISNGQAIGGFIKKIEKSKNIYLLGSGPIPPNPAELLLSEKVSKMFKDLSADFDFIIIDSPPIGAVADSQILNRFSDVNLYIVRQSYSFKNSVHIVNDIIENKKFPNLYIVVNDVKKGASYKYGYGYGNGYGYGYGYTESKKRPV